MPHLQGYARTIVSWRHPRSIQKNTKRVEILRARSHWATRFAGVESGLPCRWVDSNLQVHRVAPTNRDEGREALGRACSFATCWAFVGRPRRAARLEAPAPLKRISW